MIINRRLNDYTSHCDDGDGAYELIHLVHVCIYAIETDTSRYESGSDSCKKS